MGGWLGMAWVGAKEGVEEEAGDGETAAAAADCCCAWAAMGCATGAKPELVDAWAGAPGGGRAGGFGRFAEVAFAGACIVAGGGFVAAGTEGGGFLAAADAGCKWLGTGLVGSGEDARAAAAVVGTGTAACGAPPVQGPLSNACDAGTSGRLEGAAAEVLDKVCGATAGAADELLEPN